MMGTVVLRRKYFRVRILPLIVEFDKVFALREVLKNVFRSLDPKTLRSTWS